MCQSWSESERVKLVAHDLKITLDSGLGFRAHTIDYQIHEYAILTSNKFE